MGDDNREEKKKGKVKATELVNVHPKYLSIVTEGANGETIEILKAAVVPGTTMSGQEATGADRDALSRDERGFLRKLMEYLR